MLKGIESLAGSKHQPYTFRWLISKLSLEESTVAKRAKGGPNKSASIRELYTQNPAIQAKDIISTLAAKGIKVTPGLVYMVKGSMKGEKKRTPKAVTSGTPVATGTPTAAKSSGSSAVATIGKIKSLAGEVGGLKTLKALVDALSD
jgi:hypothetical protein